MQEVVTIENVLISVKWDNDKIILIFKNCGQNLKKIDIRCQKANGPGTESLRYFQLYRGSLETVPLPEDYENYQKLYFRVGTQKPWPNSIEVLRKLFNEVKQQRQIKNVQHDHEQLSSSRSQVVEEQSNPLAALSETLVKVKRSSRQEKIETSEHRNGPLNTGLKQQRKNTRDFEELSTKVEPEDQTQQENIIPNPQNQITQLEQLNTELQNEVDRFREQIAELLQENSDLKQQLDTRTEVMSRDPEHIFREAAHHVLQTLFKQHQKDVDETLQNPIQISNGIEAEIKRFEKQFDGEMIYALSVVKEHLTKVKGLIFFELSEFSLSEKPWENQSEQLAELVLTDKSPDDVQFPYLGELGKVYWNDLKTFATNLPQVIVEIQALLRHIVIQLLDGFSPYRAKNATEVQMARYFYKDYLPNILRMMNLELVPIEIGQTEADSRIHDIQGSQRGAYSRGVVADIIQHGIRRISDKQIIRKPVVMRGEPE